MDLPPLPIPVAPASTEYSAVALWVIGALVIIVYILARLFLSQLRNERAERIKQNSDCKKETDKAWAEVKERDATILTLTREVMRLQGETANAMSRVADALGKIDTTVRETAIHRAQS